MGLFGLFAGVDINKGVEECQATEGAVLIDVRGADEYRQGHIPGAVNIPLDSIDRVLAEYPKKDAPLFVHCLSGARSGRATSFLQRAGYSNVKNIGGINSYGGKVVR